MTGEDYCCYLTYDVPRADLKGAVGTIIADTFMVTAVNDATARKRALEVLYDVYRTDYEARDIKYELQIIRQDQLRHINTPSSKHVRLSVFDKTMDRTKSKDGYVFVNTETIMDYLGEVESQEVTDVNMVKAVGEMLAIVEHFDKKRQRLLRDESEEPDSESDVEVVD